MTKIVNQKLEQNTQSMYYRLKYEVIENIGKSMSSKGKTNLIIK